MPSSAGGAKTDWLWEGNMFVMLRGRSKGRTTQKAGLAFLWPFLASQQQTGGLTRSSAALRDPKRLER